MNQVVHDMRNQLSVAIANVEACLDGKVQPTDARLQSILKALREVDSLIDRLPR